MKRRAPGMKLVLFLLAGAIINVAVAFYAACSSKIAPVYKTQIAEAMWRYYPWLEQGRPRQGSIHRGFGYLFFSTWDEPVTLTVLRAGWPAYALDADGWGTWPEWPQPRPSIVIDRPLNAMLQDQKFPRRALPLRPLWPGFAINTLFYGAILWMLFAFPFVIRRRLRIKRGQCASCGYSLRGTPQSDKCPECGTPIGDRQIVSRTPHV